MMDSDEIFGLLFIFASTLAFISLIIQKKRHQKDMDDMERQMERFKAPRIYTWYAADGSDSPVLTSDHGNNEDSDFDYQWMWRNEYGIMGKAAARAIRMQTMAATGQTQLASILILSTYMDNFL
jgi:hypothetical protein